MANYSTVLVHHGIKGQKWGVRRYQNEDGSLTSEGKRRYLNSDGSLNESGKLRMGSDGKLISKKEMRKKIKSEYDKEFERQKENSGYNREHARTESYIDSVQKARPMLSRNFIKENDPNVILSREIESAFEKVADRDARSVMSEKYGKDWEDTVKHENAVSTLVSLGLSSVTVAAMLGMNYAELKLRGY